MHTKAAGRPCLATLLLLSDGPGLVTGADKPTRDNCLLVVALQRFMGSKGWHCVPRWTPVFNCCCCACRLLDNAATASPEDLEGGLVEARDVLLSHKHAGPLRVGITIKMGGALLCLDVLCHPSY
jgi:hypothetical protein